MLEPKTPASQGHDATGRSDRIVASQSAGEPPPDRTDPELVASMAGGDPTALAALYDRYAGSLLAVAERILGDLADAEEIVAETFTRTWEGAAGFDPGRGSVATWIVAIGRNRAIDRLRARRSRESGERAARIELARHASEAGPERKALRSEYRRHINRALEELSEVQRRAIELALWEGLTHAEIARHLDEPLGTIKTRIRTGMSRLRTALEPLYRDEFA